MRGLGGFLWYPALSLVQKPVQEPPESSHPSLGHVPFFSSQIPPEEFQSSIILGQVIRHLCKCNIWAGRFLMLGICCVLLRSLLVDLSPMWCRVFVFIKHLNILDILFLSHVPCFIFSPHMLWKAHSHPIHCYPLSVPFSFLSILKWFSWLSIFLSPFLPALCYVFIVDGPLRCSFSFFWLV